MIMKNNHYMKNLLVVINTIKTKVSLRILNCAGESGQEEIKMRHNISNKVQGLRQVYMILIKISSKSKMEKKGWPKESIR